MARQEIDLTTPQPNGKMGEPTKSAWEKVNDMTNELYDGIENHYGVPVAEALSTKRLALIAGTMRQNSSNLTQWDWINDNRHVSVGLGQILVVDGNTQADTLHISFNKEYGRVITIMAGPDETLAQQGFAVGASVNTDAFALRASINKQIAGHVRYLGGGTWEHKISTGQTIVDGPSPSLIASNLSIPHKSVPGGIYNHPSVTPYSNNADFIPRVPSVRASTNTGFVVQFFNSTFDGFLSAQDADNRFSIAYRKGFNGPIRFDGGGPSGDLALYNGNIWILGVMELADQ